jgi:hypothetical protein
VTIIICEQDTEVWIQDSERKDVEIATGKRGFQDRNGGIREHRKRGIGLIKLFFGTTVFNVII